MDSVEYSKHPHDNVRVQLNHSKTLQKQLAKKYEFHIELIRESTAKIDAD